MVVFPALVLVQVLVLNLVVSSVYILIFQSSFVSAFRFESLFRVLILAEILAGVTVLGSVVVLSFSSVSSSLVNISL